MQKSPLSALAHHAIPDDELEPLHGGSSEPHHASAELKGTSGEYTMLGELISQTTRTWNEALNRIARK